ncbi:MAG: SWIM zinc finger family protein, partial [Roseiflexaceae bacterium]
DIETAFDAVGVPLFPRGPQDISATCSCPDYANPCKHIAAVYFLLGERFDEDPFLIFQARGRTREQIVDALRALRAGASEEPAPIEHVPVETVPALAELLATFYQADPELDTIQAQIATPAIDSILLKRYGPAPADTDSDLRAMYRAITARALERVHGEEEASRA